MKKLAVFGAVLLVVVGLATSPALAATGSAQDALVLSAGDQAFLATLAVPEVTPAPELTAKRPGVVAKALCTVTVNCGSTSVSCSSNTSSVDCEGVNRNCAAGERGRVTCNGVTTWCPLCPPPPSYCQTLLAQCITSCPNECVKSFRCSPYSCVCGPPCI